MKCNLLWGGLVILSAVVGIGSGKTEDQGFNAGAASKRGERVYRYAGPASIEVIDKATGEATKQTFSTETMKKDWVRLDGTPEFRVTGPPERRELANFWNPAPGAFFSETGAIEIAGEAETTVKLKLNREAIPQLARKIPREARFVRCFCEPTPLNNGSAYAYYEIDSSHRVPFWGQRNSRANEPGAGFEIVLPMGEAGVNLQLLGCSLKLHINGWIL